MIDAEEGTNFDFYIAFASSGRVCFELKLTEQEFGKADADAAHLKKLQDLYRPRLAGKVREEALAPESFFAQYQIMRNVAYADPLGNGLSTSSSRAPTEPSPRSSHSSIRSLQPSCAVLSG